MKYVMRVRRGFNPRIDRMESGSREIRISEGIRTRAVVFRLTSGEREALVTNLGEDALEEGVFPELYYKRWPVETKYILLFAFLNLLTVGNFPPFHDSLLTRVPVFWYTDGEHRGG